VNLKQIVYAILCVVAVGYLMTANARGYVPFAAPAGRTNGGAGGRGGFFFFFHK